MGKVDRAAVGRLLTHNVTNVIEREHLQARILKKERLRVKLGMDPTAPDVHLGHAILLRKLRAFQELGHTVVLIIGDATVRVGDPSGRSKVRPPLSDDEIKLNAATYFAQVRRFLDLRRVEFRSNSEWLDRLTLSELVKLLEQVTVARVLERDDFAKRMRAGMPIGLHETLYPILQAYDSVAVRADVELGGTDQTFNLLAGRDLQPRYGQAAQDILTTPLLVGLDGREKMSKSLGNYVGITEPPDAMIGKLMTIPDAVIAHYAGLAADWPEEKIKKLPARLKKENPRDVKLEVAQDIVMLYHGDTVAGKTVKAWLRMFHEKQAPTHMPTKKLKTGAWDVAGLLVAAGFAASKSEARRLVQQGGVHHNEARLSTNAKVLTLRSGDVLQAGKRKFIRIG